LNHLTHRPTALATTDHTAGTQYTARTMLHTEDHWLQTQLHTHLIGTTAVVVPPGTSSICLKHTLSTEEKIHNAAETMDQGNYLWNLSSMVNSVCRF